MLPFQYASRTAKPAKVGGATGLGYTIVIAEVVAVSETIESVNEVVVSNLGSLLTVPEPVTP